MGVAAASLSSSSSVVAPPRCGYDEFGGGPTLGSAVGVVSVAV